VPCWAFFGDDAVAAGKCPEEAVARAGENSGEGLRRWVGVGCRVGRGQARDERRRGQRPVEESCAGGRTGSRGAEQLIRRQKGCRGRRREEKIRRTDLEISESSRVSQQTKISH
jgi:hypothetical protein